MDIKEPRNGQIDPYKKSLKNEALLAKILLLLWEVVTILKFFIICETRCNKFKVFYQGIPVKNFFFLRTKQKKKRRFDLRFYYLKIYKSMFYLFIYNDKILNKAFKRKS